jgi:hypothetical protein
MQRDHRVPPQHPRRIEQSAMRAALLEALRGRVARDPAGLVSLPTGRANVSETARVLTALDRAHSAEGRR